MARVNKLVEAVLELVGTASEMSSINQEDNMIISPQSLNALCASALFSDIALNGLYELAEKQVSTSESNYSVFHNNSSEISVVIPCKLVSLYGDIFVELVRLASDNVYVFLFQVSFV
jgi:hypothetical protein